MPGDCWERALFTERSTPVLSHGEDFQHLVAEVGLGRAGIVLGLEVSRLARNSAYPHHLLEL